MDRSRTAFILSLTSTARVIGRSFQFNWPRIHSLISMTQPKARHLDRRQFLRASALAVGAFHLIPAQVLAAPGRPGANERFVIGHIGVGGMAMTHLNNMLRFQKEGKVRIAAVCDADEN